jgi:predicted amidohydrolase
MRTLSIGLIQMRCDKAAVAGNLAGTAETFADAAARGIDIVAFPEATLSGYIDPGQHPEAVLSLAGPEVGHLLEVTRGHRTTLLAGLVEANPRGKPYITHFVARDGRLLGAYRKMTNVDEDAEWYASGEAVPVFRHGPLTFGLAICADIANRHVFAECARQGAQIVFEVAAPGLYGEQATRDWRSGFEWWEGECRSHLSRYAAGHGFWIAVATQAGRTVDEDFPGGGYLFAPGGKRLYATPDGSPGAVYLEIDLEAHRVRARP